MPGPQHVNDRQEDLPRRHGLASSSSVALVLSACFPAGVPKSAARFSFTDHPKQHDFIFAMLNSSSRLPVAGDEKTQPPGSHSTLFTDKFLARSIPNTWRRLRMILRLKMRIHVRRSQAHHPPPAPGANSGVEWTAGKADTSPIRPECRAGEDFRLPNCWGLPRLQVQCLPHQ